MHYISEFGDFGRQRGVTPLINVKVLLFVLSLAWVARRVKTSMAPTKMLS
jgi:hypothetical protein